MNKTCKKCGISKELSQFYKHCEMEDGYLNICISCKRLDAKKYRTENIEKIRENDRARGRTKKRKEQNKKQVKKIKKSNPNGYKAMRREAVKKSRNKYSEKYLAWLQVQKAIKLGEIIRPEYCSLCEKKKKTDAHHKDYSKPFDVIWLCKECHGKEHRK